MNQKGKSLYALLILLVAEAIQITFAAIMIIIVALIQFFQTRNLDGQNGPMSRLNNILQEGISRQTQYGISAISILFCGIVFAVWYHQEVKKEEGGRNNFFDRIRFFA